MLFLLGAMPEARDERSIDGRSTAGSVSDCRACHASSALASPQTPDEQALLKELFETRVRPVLVNRCEECHDASADGGLRVDSREALLRGGNSGAAIVPGNPDGSLLVQAVRHAHEKLRMPKKRAKLPDAEIDALVEWISAGAYWPADATPAVVDRSIRPEQRAFWSFQPLAHPAVPAVRDAAWSKTDVDRFVLARLEAEGLAPVAPADKRALIRRATLDLTGLVPAPEDVEAFVANTSPDAFAKVVDRLLASPAYGETWGRWWLDVARYGEDDCRSLDPMGRGYNPYPNAYLYRDWVVQAFNDDLPFDVFARAQLAADSMEPPARVRMLPALGFLGLGPWYYDNGSVEVTRADERHDRVDAVTRGFLGLTVACARCHDHKYDPIRTEDYYALAGVFLNSPYHEYPRVPAAVAEEYKAAEKKIKNKEKLLGEFLETEGKQLSQTLALQASKYMRAAWKVLGEPKKDKARVASDEKLDYELFDRWLAFLVKPPRNYPYLKAWQDLLARRGTKEEAAKLADEFQELLLGVLFEHREAEEENEIIRAKALPGTKKKERAELPNEFVTNDDFCPGCGLELKGLSTEKGNLWTDAFERDLDSGTSLAQEGDGPFKPGLFRFEGWGLERQLGVDRRRYLDDLRADVEALRKALPPKFPYVHGVEEAKAIVPIRVHLRGSPFKLGEEVPRRFLDVLSPPDAPPFREGSGRRELAEAIVQHALFARVIVNRVWKHHFGTGIVDTPSNFGQVGERPTHPELLEFLASRFVEQGFSLKKLHRELLLSAVYQLGATQADAAFAKDSGNRLYWRANTRRMTAEQIRDSVLFVSGALDAKPYGPSAKLTLSNKRRTIYGAVSRYKLDRFLALFDFPPPQASSERRFTTQVPLQRLFFMNSEFVQQQAELLAARVAGEADDAARVRKLYSILFGRAPEADEVSAGLEYVRAEPMREYEERKAALEAAKAAEAAKSAEAAKAAEAAKVTQTAASAEVAKSAEPAKLAPAATSTELPQSTAAAKPAEGATSVEVAKRAGTANGTGDAPGSTAVAAVEPAKDAAAAAPAARSTDEKKDKPQPADGEESEDAMAGDMLTGMSKGASADEAKKPPLPVSVWGRYAKVLLSSNEFLFIR